MYNWDLAKRITRRFRSRRFRGFAVLFPPEQCKRILDLGGSASIWEMMDYPGEITLLNIDKNWLEIPKVQQRRRYISMVGDGRQTSFKEGCFDLVFSNSVIEHVGGEEDAVAFAGEIRRLGKAYYCQTPNKWFPIEPHYGTLFLHWYPKLLDNYYVFRYLTLWGVMHKPTRETAQKVARDSRLLTKRDMKWLFPEAEIMTEKVMWLFSKSVIAFKKPSAMSEKGNIN
jgi:SAM-dependent methyltransferase